MTQLALDLNELSFFIGIARQASLSAAAKSLGVPKSTLSRKLTQLEERLSIKLLHRTPRRMRLTEAGSLLFERCGEALAQLEEAASSVSSLQSAARGRLRISAPTFFGEAVLSPLLVQFRQAHPEISLEVFLSDHFIDLAAEGFDVAVRLGESRDGSLVTRRIGTVEAVLLASPAYLAQHGTPRSPDDLHDHACLVHNTPPYTPQWTLFGPKGLERTLEMSGPFVANSLPLVRAAAVGGVGIARLPTYMCRDDIAGGRLQRILPEWSAGDRPVFLAYPGRRYLSGKVKVFLDFLLEHTGKDFRF